MLLTGTFTRSVDQKHRVAIPKRLRSAFEGLETSSGDQASSGQSPANVGLYIAPGTDGSIAIYTQSAFRRLAEKLAAGSPNREETRAYSRLFYARAQYVEMDAQGRIRIEPELCIHAGLVDEAVMVGVGDHIELWNAARWATYEQQQQARYDELAERAFQPDPLQ